MNLAAGVYSRPAAPRMLYDFSRGFPIHARH